MVNYFLYCPPTHPLLLPHMHVTKTKKLVISIWHLAILIRFHCPMVLSFSPLGSRVLALFSSSLSSPPLSSLPLYPPPFCGSPVGGDLRPQRTQ